ncbi:chromosome partitioning protein, ParB family [Dehalogenimonas formicexedens]|uniref:Chromosome partitioning protein, ParB family n=2 Tax=Dehalogenimonas TaxID=670486 RepID=A0A1P8F8N8_9CHLR|nr:MULTISPECIES: ParB/RepB/Spo0J family partition protein [Dehalogenimonas]APV44772.1 chromosome partitioning protein, ParB family [Dehalogenimonas formicexedens]KTB48860.1 putative transcriptional regulator [Dehalogenimonas alkenigignens]
MKIITLPLTVLVEAPWNPNQMDEAGFERLKNSLTRYGLVEPLVVRPIQSLYEVLSGNQRLKVIKDIGIELVPCVVVDLKDAEAMLLAQALNGLRGQDDLALKGALLKEILSSIPESEVLSVLPETSQSLSTLSTISEGTLAEHLEAWEQAQAARLSHMQLQFTRPQLETVQEALARILPVAKDSSKDNPNTRGTAMYLLCKFFLERYQPE